MRVYNLGLRVSEFRIEVQFLGFRVLSSKLHGLVGLGTAGTLSPHRLYRDLLSAEPPETMGFWNFGSGV